MDLARRIPELERLPHDSTEFKAWRRNTEVTIAHTFGEGSTHVQEFRQIRFIPSGTSFGRERFGQFYTAHVNGLNSAAAMLQSMIEEISEYWDDDSPTISPDSAASDQEATNEVFIVHGRDDGAKETVARFLRQLELEPIILHEQPNQGRTIIEKFEDYAQVGFAFVLLTPDDECVSQENGGETRFRARQNVIFELGYFIGKLGRSKTCALFKGDLDIPSDYDGVLYIEMDDDGAWKQHLVREMKSAGIEIDANRMF